MKVLCPTAPFHVKQRPLTGLQVSGGPWRSFGERAGAVGGRRPCPMPAAHRSAPSNAGSMGDPIAMRVWRCGRHADFDHVNALRLEVPEGV